MTILEDGDVGILDEHGLRKEGRVHTGRVYRFAGHEVAAAVLRERQVIAQEGVAMVVVPVDANGHVAGAVTIATRGVIEADAGEALLASAKEGALEAVRTLPKSAGVRKDDAAIAEAVRLAVRRILSRALGFKPVTVVQVVRVAG